MASLRNVNPSHSLAVFVQLFDKKTEVIGVASHVYMKGREPAVCKPFLTLHQQWSSPGSGSQDWLSELALPQAVIQGPTLRRALCLL